MASKETWNKLNYFKKDSSTDKWGDADAICDDLVLALDDFRRFIGVPFYITNGVSITGHASKSFHYRENGACAVDGVPKGYKKKPIDLILDASRFGFRGIGWYPHWKIGGKVVGGLHLDWRPLQWEEDFTLNYGLSRWIGVPTSSYIDGKLVEKLSYYPMTEENIIKFGRTYGHY